jgi:hypothetical protein
MDVSYERNIITLLTTPISNLVGAALPGINELRKAEKAYLGSMFSKGKYGARYKARY